MNETKTVEFFFMKDDHTWYTKLYDIPVEFFDNDPFTEEQQAENWLWSCNKIGKEIKFCGVWNLYPELV